MKIKAEAHPAGASFAYRRSSVISVAKSTLLSRNASGLASLAITL
jgi:hypothetical protein